MPGSIIDSLREGASRSLALLRRLARRDSPPASGDPAPAAPVAAAQPAMGAPSQGPPADWLERVRRGAPHLLIPAEPTRVERPGVPGPAATRPSRGSVGSPDAALRPPAPAPGEPHPAPAARAASAEGGSAERPSVLDRVRAAARAFADPTSDGRDPATRARPAQPAEAPAARPRAADRGETGSPSGVTSPAAPTGFRLRPIDDAAPGARDDRAGGAPARREPPAGDGAARAPRVASSVGRSAEAPRVGDRAALRAMDAAAASPRPDDRTWRASGVPDQREPSGWVSLPGDASIGEPGRSSERAAGWPWPGLPSAYDDRPAHDRIALSESWAADDDGAPDDEYGVWPALPPRSDGQDGVIAVVAAELDAHGRMQAERSAALRREQESWL